MGYDKSTAQSGSEADSYPHASTTTNTNNYGHLRVKSAPYDPSILSQPLTLPFSGRQVKNRFLKAPMTERLCTWNTTTSDITTRGVPTPEFTRLYQRWGEGEIGIIVQGNTMIRYDAVEAFGNPILPDDHDNRVSAYAEVAKVAKAHGSLFVAQLSHPGRQGGAALNPRPVSASDVHLKIKWAGNEFNPPRALTVPEIKQIVREFGETAWLCYQAGYDGVQVHCAHGYLLAQFLSQTTNKRTDEYGGSSLENRSRIIFEIIEEIQRRVSDKRFVVCVKINSVEFQEGGTSPDDCKELCIRLEAARVDFVDLSGGTFESRAFEHKKESTKAREAYFIEFAEMIRPHLKKTLVYVTGGFRTGSGMAHAISSNASHGVGIGRPLAAEPFLCRDLLSGKVTGAIENLVPLPQNTQASGSQIHQVGKGDSMISDWSDEGEVKRWIEANEKETQRKISVLPKVDSSGYPVLRAEVGFEYLK